jgi:hypothetical protein
MANWEADIAAGKTVGETGFPMEKMETLARTYIPAKHALFLFDNCHAGWALSMGEGEESEIERRWASGVKFGIAAAPKDGFAHDPEKGGFSIFSRYVIDGLSLADGTPARADKIDGCGSADHIVTHEELLEYLKREVPAAMLRELKGQEQVPTGRRYDDSEDGQFLFVAPDAEKVLKDRHCDAGQ